jgi:hypothetical protein
MKQSEIEQSAALYAAAKQWERVGQYLWRRAMSTGDWEPFSFALDAMRLCENLFRISLNTKARSRPRA